MKNLIILGTGEFALESYYWLKDMVDGRIDMKFKGFLSPINSIQEDSPLYHYYLGDESTYHFLEEDYVVVAIASNLNLKKDIIKFLVNKNCKFFNIIHPTSIIKTDKIGKGNIFTPYTIISYDVEIGNHNSFNCYVSIGHHAKIGNYNTINSHSDITGYCFVGNSNFFGSSSVMLPKSSLGNENKIAASSVIYKRFKNNLLISGNPAMKIG